MTGAALMVAAAVVLHVGTRGRLWWLGCSGVLLLRLLRPANLRRARRPHLRPRTSSWCGGRLGWLKSWSTRASVLTFRAVMAFCAGFCGAFYALGLPFGSCLTRASRCQPHRFRFAHSLLVLGKWAARRGFLLRRFRQVCLVGDCLLEVGVYSAGFFMLVQLG